MELSPEQQALVARYNHPQLLEKVTALQQNLRRTLAVILSDFHVSLAAGRGQSEEDVALREAITIDMEIRVRLAADELHREVQELIREWDAANGHGSL
jgi:hypothetical protein